MSEQTIAEIRESRDTALQVLNVAYDALGHQIARTTQTGAFLDALGKRREDIKNERAHLYQSATDAVLELPSVLAAAATLNGLSEQMSERAAELSNITKLLVTAGAILSLGQQFSDILAQA